MKAYESIFFVKRVSILPVKPRMGLDCIRANSTSPAIRDIVILIKNSIIYSQVNSILSKLLAYTTIKL